MEIEDNSLEYISDTPSNSLANPDKLNSASFLPKFEGNSVKKDNLSEDVLTQTKSKLDNKVEELTTKTAVSLLVSGKITSKLCRYCLEVTDQLSDLEKVVEIGSKGGIYSVTLRDMVVCFHPFQVHNDPNFPNKICEKCVDRTINSYLFIQQCEQSERALRNCFEDIYNKLEKLDPLEGKKHTRGRKKIHFNHNRINAAYSNVIDYADPIYHLISSSKEKVTHKEISALECLKCFQVLPNIEALANHSKTHPKSMWYSCKYCGKLFSQMLNLKRHFREHRKVPISNEEKFECKTCGETNDKYYNHLQHIETHKFKMVLDYLVHSKMDKLCSVCLDKGDLVPLNKPVSMHGGPPELMGLISMQTILASAVPELHLQNNDNGLKICENCINNAITAYTFKNHINFTRDRLNTCIQDMLEQLKDISPESNLVIEVSKNILMPLKEIRDDDSVDNNTLLEDESKLEILEDEYRLKSDEETDSDKKIKQEYNDKEFTQKVHMNGHQTKEKKIDKKFTCPICSKHYLSDYFMKRHIIKHTPQKVTCIPCGTIFGNKFSLAEHEKYAHKLFKSDYRTCNTCKRGFTKENKLKQHEEQHKNKLCCLCNKVFKTQKFFDSHLQRHKLKLLELQRKLVQSCSFCEKVFSNDNQLSIHVNKVHLQIKPYSCDMCEKQFYTEYNLKYHKKIHDRKTKEICHFCNKILHTRKQLVIHIRKHIGATPHNCQLCKESYYSIKRLKDHMKLTHGGTVVCKICKQVLDSKSELKVHINKAHSFLQPL